MIKLLLLFLLPLLSTTSHDPTSHTDLDPDLDPDPPARQDNKDDIPPEIHAKVEKEEHHVVQTKTKLVAKPGESQETTSKVSPQKYKERPLPRHQKISVSDIKNRAKVRQYVHTRYQAGAPPKLTITKSPVNKNKHGQAKKHKHRHRHGHRHLKKKEMQRKLYKKHVGHTVRKHRRRGILLRRSEYLRRRQEIRKRRREYLRKFEQRRQRRLAYLRKLRQRRRETQRRRLTLIARQKHRTKRLITTTNTTAVHHHHDKDAKTRLLKTYLKKKTDAEKQKHDAERKVVQAYLLFRLYEMVRGYLNTQHSCQKHFVQVQVGADSPAFGGKVLSWF